MAQFLEQSVFLCVFSYTNSTISLVECESLMRYEDRTLMKIEKKNNQDY